MFNSLPHNPLGKRSFRKQLRKGRKYIKEHSLLIEQCFSSNKDRNHRFSNIYFIVCRLDESKIMALIQPLSQTSPEFYMFGVQVFSKQCEKMRNCSSRAMSPFPTVFSTHLQNFLPFLSILKLSFVNSFSLEESTGNLSFGKGICKVF